VVVVSWLDRWLNRRLHTREVDVLSDEEIAAADRWLNRHHHTREVGQSRGKGPAIGPPPCPNCMDMARRMAVHRDAREVLARMSAVNAQLRQERDALQWLADPVHMAAYLLAREAVEEG
jgi:hypothetical protein